jgi:exopolysaccharide biosynthesis polyprenyl glycosylphosphotransferase
LVNFRRQLLLNALKLSDVCLMVVSFGLATLAVSHTSNSGSLEEFLSMRVKVGNFVLFAALLLSWHAIFSSFKLYASHRLARRRDEIIDLVKACSLGTFFVLLAAVIFHVKLVTPLFLLAFWASSIVATITSRLGLRFVLKRIRIHGRNLRHMLIVGSNQRAVDFAKKIDASPGLGYRIVGFVDQEWSGIPALQAAGYSLASDFDGLPRFLRGAVVDEVVIALPMRSLHFRASQVAALCEQQGIVLRFISNLFDLKSSRAHAEDFGGDSLITHYAGTAEGWPVVVKRALDIAVSLAGLIVLAPVLTLTAILIRLTSRGPVLFVQKRLGLNKRRFNVYKFRTMVPDAERRMTEVEHLNEVSGPVFKIKNDPRITLFGKFLRKASIDELPQLLNVLKGDMSLVGPRPLPVRDYEGFNEDWQRRRFSVRPGITCLWQINGRNSIPFEKWMELDLQYIDKWSLWLDLEILLRTIPAVLRGSGAA